MVLSFKKIFPWGDPTDFENKILQGIKIHSFREDVNERWLPGRKIQHATGVRTKFYNCFKDDSKCENIEIIRVINKGRRYQGMKLLVGRQWRNIPIIWQHEVARNDGFNNLTDFYKYFNQVKQDLRIIHWTALLYRDVIFGKVSYNIRFRDNGTSRAITFTSDFKVPTEFL